MRSLVYGIAALLLSFEVVMAASPPTELGAHLDRLRELDRQRTLVLEDVDERNAAGLRRDTQVAWRIHADATATRDEIRDLLTRAIARPAAEAGAEDLVGLLCNHLRARPNFPAPDDLVFRDLADDVASQVGEESKQPERLRAEQVRCLRDVVSRLDDLRGRLGAEVPLDAPSTEAVRLRRRGWGEYVQGLRRSINRDAILERYRGELESLGLDKVLESDSGQVVIGSSLPAKSVLLTLDDGPHAKHTAVILDTLAHYGAKASFFQLGQLLGTYETGGTATLGRLSPVAIRTRKAGHLLANHSYSHPLMTRLSRETVAREIDATNALLSAVDRGVRTLFRPPYGARNEVLRHALASRHMKVVLWNVDSLDWRDHVPESVAVRVILGVRRLDRGLVLLHDIHSQTALALPIIMKRLRADGYQFADPRLLLAEP